MRPSTKRLLLKLNKTFTKYFISKNLVINKKKKISCKKMSANNLECPICNEKYTFSDRLPKLLTCKKHVLCLSCLKKIISNENPLCPFDRYAISKELVLFQDCPMERLFEFNSTAKISLNKNKKESVIEAMSLEVEQLGYDKSEDKWVEAFIQDFATKGKNAIDAHESKFGTRDVTRLKKAVQANAVLKMYSDSLTKEEVRDLLANELKELDYDANGSDSWIDEFIRSFTNKGVTAVDDFEAKFGTRDVNKLKNAINQNSDLASYSGSIKKVSATTKVVSEKEAMAELENVLGELEYIQSKNDWLEDFLKAFASSGLESIAEFKAKFGERDATTVEKEVQNNALLNSYCKKLPAAITSVSTKEAALELEAILSEMDYEKGENPWLSGVIKKFTNKGSVDSIDEYSSKFGQNDSKKLRSNIMSNP